MEAGEFDDLPGTGKPIPDLDRPYDPAWWAKEWVRREDLKTRAMALATRIERRLPRILALHDEAAAAAELDELAAEVASLNATLAPQDRLDDIDVAGLLRVRRTRLGRR